LSGTPFTTEGKAAIMERALASAAISILYQDASLAIIYAENLLPYFQTRFVAGGDDGSLFGEAHGKSLAAIKRTVLETGDRLQNHPSQDP
jgi:hypothetical protein